MSLEIAAARIPRTKGRSAGLSVQGVRPLPNWFLSCFSSAEERPRYGERGGGEGRREEGKGEGEKQR